MRRSWVLAVACAAGCGGGAQPDPPAAAAGRGVALRKAAGGWELVRNGAPYVVRGAGGSGSVDLLRQLGGNSVRTWGADQLPAALAACEAADVTVCAGLWVGHARHGFDYKNAEQVARQAEQIKETVLKHKDSPAILVWAIGNEMEGPGAGDDPAVWTAVNDLAKLVKRLDPTRPTMTVVAEIGGTRVRNLHALCPDIDIVGINSYGGAASLPRRYREAGGTKPYLLTEFGPPGPWEVGKTRWGSPLEPTSTDKARAYARAHRGAVAESGGLCLGSYAFLWGSKQETTATWFGMLLPDGSRLAAADAMAEIWTGRPPPNRCPVIASLAVVGPADVDGGATVRADLATSDPEDDPLAVEWVLRADPRVLGVGGDAEVAAKAFPEAVVSRSATRADVKLPPGGGAYRLFAYVRDGKGGAAVANVPLRAKPPPGAAATLPLVVFDEPGRERPPFAPSGWMGNTKALKLDERCPTTPKAGKACVRIDYTAPDGWAGICWQDPPDDFGDKPGGWDVTGAKHLTVWVRGEAGTEEVTVGFGLVGDDKPFPDTARGRREKLRLTTDWQQVRLPLAGDLTRIKSGFVITLVGAGRPVTVYLDDCRFE